MPGQKTKRVTSIYVNRTQIHDDKEIANSFNKFFTETVDRLVQVFGQCLSSARSFKFLMSGPSYTFRFEEVSVDYIRDQLKKLKTKNAVGLDQLPSRLLKDSAEIIAKPLTTLINASLIYGCVPSEWKWARVNPLFKNGKANDMDNYQPISVLPTISKVLERVVHTSLYDFLAKEKLLSPYQCGFCKSHSTELAVLSFTDSIRRSMDQGLLTGAVFIDLRKAFDTVDHDLLLEKLTKGYGVTGKELGWFKDYYLTDR